MYAAGRQAGNDEMHLLGLDRHVRSPAAVMGRKGFPKGWGMMLKKHTDADYHGLHFHMLDSLSPRHINNPGKSTYVRTFKKKQTGPLPKSQHTLRQMNNDTPLAGLEPLCMARDVPVRHV